ncbi:MAG TPA: SDR family oxidoreductase [Candidatus Krumholzibacteria bacterium]|nr:SDR family oxidoreductase [Candidatus Krumholzibacteria bacterium]
MKQPLKGKVALITGGASPIGQATAEALHGAGARVVLHYRSSKTEAERVAKKIGGLAIAGTLPQDADRIVGEAARRFGRLDVLVNNASFIEPAGWTEDLEKLDFDMWRRAFEADVLGTFACSRAAARVMKRGGKIITIGSIPAMVGDRDGIIYATAKAAIIGMTKSLALLLAPKVQVNCMALGSVETGWTKWLTPEKRKAYESVIPLGRFGKPEEVAALALFLATAPWMTGQTLVLDGGETRC